MKTIFSILAHTLILVFLFFSSHAQALTVESDHIEVRLISLDQSFSKSSMTIGVHYKLDPHWHVYWKNPGDSGAAPKFEVSSGKIKSVSWPAPDRINVSNLTNYGYNKEAVVFLELEDLGATAKIDLEWLVCKVECVPGFATIDLTSSNIEQDQELFEKFQNRLPQKNNLEVKYSGQGKDYFTFSLQLSDKQDSSELYVFPQNGELFLTPPPTLSVNGGSIKISVPKSPNATNKNESESFTLVFKNKNEFSSAVDVSIKPIVARIDFLIGLILAFLGGLILNIMPCVFPILFLKAYGFVKNKDRKAVLKSSWLYTLGVLLSFFAMGGLLLILRTSGRAVGWGFQLQNPYIVAALCLLFLLMALSFLDVIKLENIIPAKWMNPGSKTWLNGDLGTGVLAVVIASPCTAPFMGTALGLTLLLGPIESLAIFMALGLGFALPVPLLAHWPALINKLPNMGPWMVTAKKLMAIPLILTSVWLFWVLGQQTFLQQKSSENWNAFDSKRIEEVRKTQTVFIDFTAAWCITCQVNKQTVLDTAEVQSFFEKNNVYLVRADWTNYDPAITKALEKHGRNSVPLYVIYSKKSASEIILPEILTKNELFSKIKNNQ